MFRRDGLLNWTFVAVSIFLMLGSTAALELPASIGGASGARESERHSRARTSSSESSVNRTSVSVKNGFRLRLRFDPSKDPMWTNRIIFTALYGILFLLGLANVLVLFIVSRYGRMRTVTNILIFNLCLADLVYISFLPVVIMFQLLRDWMFGVAVCKLFYIAESTAKYASVYFVSVLSLDRYLAMCHPHWCKRYRHPGLALTVSAVGWLVTAALMTPIYLYSTVIGNENTSRICTVVWPPSQFEDLTSAMCANDSCNSGVAPPFFFSDNETFGNFSFPYTPPSVQFYFVTLTFIFCFSVPATVILFFYFKVVDQLMQASNRAERLKKKREKTYRKVTRMVLAVITCYVLCWTPYWAQFLVVTYATNIVVNDALKIVFNSIHLLPYLNCAINPILYSLMTENFRRILVELFPCSPCCACAKCDEQRRKMSEYSQNRKISTRPPRRQSTAFELEHSTNGAGLFSVARGSFEQRTRSASCAQAPYDAIDEDENDLDSRRLVFVRPSITESIRFMSDFSLNFLAFRSQISVATAASNETTL